MIGFNNDEGFNYDESRYWFFGSEGAFDLYCDFVQGRAYFLESRFFAVGQLQ